jgi:hypothetical protein
MSTRLCVAVHCFLSSDPFKIAMKGRVHSSRLDVLPSKAVEGEAAYHSFFQSKAALSFFKKIIEL